MNIVECVQEVAPELDILGFGYMKTLDQTYIRIRVTGSSDRSLGWAIPKGKWRWLGKSVRADPLITLEGAPDSTGLAAELLR